MRTVNFFSRLLVFSFVVGLSQVALAQSLAVDDPNDQSEQQLGQEQGLNDFIDDSRIKSRLYARGNELLEAEGLVDGETILRQLSEAPSTAAVELTPLQQESGDSKFTKCYKSTLVLSNLFNCGKCQNTHLASGGGVVLTADGLLLTNYHVIDNEDVYNFFAMTSDGKVYPVVEVIAANKDADVALIRIDAEDLTPISLATEQPEPMSDLFVISHPHDRYYSTATGVVSRYSRRSKRDGPKEQWMEITAVFSQGSSGCGVFDFEGKINWTGLAKGIRSFQRQRRQGSSSDDDSKMRSAFGDPGFDFRRPIEDGKLRRHK